MNALFVASNANTYLETIFSKLCGIICVFSIDSAFIVESCDNWVLSNGEMLELDEAEPDGSNGDE